MICGVNAPRRDDRHKKVSPEASPPIGGGIGRLAGPAAVAFSGVLALRRVDDFDTWWHLAAGRWIALHRAVPTTDTLSHTVRNHTWIDLQWGFDLGAYVLHALGGAGLLSFAAAAGFTLAMVLTFRLLKGELGPVAAALLTILVVLVAQDRFAVRPELLSFPLLALVITVLESGERREGRGLWRLVPLMVVWANVHALYVIGVFAILSSMAGSLLTPKRGVLLWGGLAVGAVLVNPYGIAAVAFPFKLLSRIDGSNAAFQTIAEFRSPFLPDAGGLAVTAYKALLVLGIVAAGAALAIRRRRFDFGGVLFAAGLGALSIAARRNAALFAVGAAPFIARSLATAFASLPRGIKDAVTSRATLAGGAVLVAAPLLAASVVSGAFYKWDHQPREFGAGVIDGTFPVRAAAAIREAGLPPQLYNDVAAGGYLAWDDPLGQGVFIDGRLEVYDDAFFADYVAAMYDPVRFDAAAERYGVQTVVLFHRWENRRLLVERLFHSGTWSLVYADEVAAVFVRAAGNEALLARAAGLTPRWNDATRAWLSRPVPRWPYPAGRVEGTRAFARLLATLGDAEGAVEAYRKVLELDVPAADEIDVRLILARRFAGTGRLDEARDQARRVLVLAPGNLEARQLLR